MPIPGVGFPEIAIILVAALLIFGPNKLPELMGQAGKALREFRSMTGNLQSEFEKNINDAAGTDVRKTLSNEIAGLKGEVAAATKNTSGKPAVKTSSARPVPATAGKTTSTPATARAAATTTATAKKPATTGSTSGGSMVGAGKPVTALAEPEPTGEIEFLPVRTTSRRGGSSTAAPSTPPPARAAVSATPDNGSASSARSATRPAAVAPASDDADPFARARSRRQTAAYNR